jgi:folate-binding protein YgfZ
MSQQSTANQAAREGAGVIDRTARGRIVVSGSDRRSYLQGLLTNDIEALTAGQGCYAAYLTPQGRMIADLWMYELGDVLMITLAGEVKAAVLAKFDQFIFSEDVQLGDVSDTFSQIAVVGPAAPTTVAAVMSGAGADELRAMPEHGNRRLEYDGSAASVTRITDTGEPGFDLYVERSRAAALQNALTAAGAVGVDAAIADALRIEGGIPLFHVDMDEETIPLEAGIESRAISFSKGCYVGQEVIIRVLHRGHGRVARKLVGLRIESSDVPSRGVGVRAGDREIGEVTSAAWSPGLAQPIALAYLHRDFVEPRTRVSIEDRQAEVVPLPFVRTSQAIRSASAGGNSSDSSSVGSTQRIS